jgi:hypothetical protein
VSVARLTVAPPAVNQKLVELLRDLLACAERGEIVSIVAAMTRTGGETAIGLAVDDPRSNAAGLVFAIESAKFRMFTRIHLERTDG